MAHEVQAQDPDPQRQVMAGEDGIGQVVEPLATAMAVVSLALGLGVVRSVLGDLVGATLDAPHAVGPAHLPERVEALGVVDENLNVDPYRVSQGAKPANVAIPHSWRLDFREDAIGNTDSTNSLRSAICFKSLAEQKK